MPPLVAAHAPATPRLVRSLIGKKVIMAVTGVILLLFVIAHLLGNLEVFQGAAHFNAYAEGLRTLGAPFLPRGLVLWVARVVLVVAVGAHIWAAIAVTRASWGARPVGYHALEAVETTYAARTMRWGGVIIVLYVIYHLLDFTFGRVNPSFVPGDVRSEEHTSELQSPCNLVCRLLLEKKKTKEAICHVDQTSHPTRLSESRCSP